MLHLHFPYIVQDGLEDRIMRLNPRLGDACALRAAFAMENSNYLLS